MDGRKISRLFQFLASLQCFQHFLISPLLPDKLSLMGKICFQLSPFPVKYGNINNIITITSLWVTICTGGASLLSKESTNNSCVTLPTNIGWHCTWIMHIYFSQTFIFIILFPGLLWQLRVRAGDLWGGGGWWRRVELRHRVLRQVRQEGRRQDGLGELGGKYPHNIIDDFLNWNNLHLNMSKEIHFII